MKSNTPASNGLALSTLLSSLFCCSLLLEGCGKTTSLQTYDPSPNASTVLSTELLTRSHTPDPKMQNCAECHQDAHGSWKTSQHAMANQVFDESLHGEPFEKTQSFVSGGTTTTVTKIEGESHVLVDGPDGNFRYKPAAIIGTDPLIQYLIPFPGGRFQVLDWSYDPKKNEWFNVFGDDNRLSNEWGHWTQQGMNWNSQCASCHMTTLEKQFDASTNAYSTTWAAMGINCNQCHGDTTAHGADPDNESLFPPKVDRNQAMETCAPCHARREELTSHFEPLDKFSDHYRLALVDSSDIYYADGQVQGENYVYTSLKHSSMGAHGVTCMDCHDPHSTKNILPWENNSLCMQCHTSPERSNGKVIPDMVAHSKHPINSTGWQCVNCHMPETTYMGNDPRRDHGFTIPDPVMTKEFGIPNACNRCHTDQTVDWAVEHANRWFGDKMDPHKRKRTRAISGIRGGDQQAYLKLLEVYQAETNIYWKISMLNLMAPWVEDSAVGKIYDEALKSEEPQMRSEAIRGLSSLPDAYTTIRPFREDPSRMVRIDAAHATLNPGERGEHSYTELLAFLKQMSDQPVGALRNAQRHFSEGHPDKAFTWALRARSLDKGSPDIHQVFGTMAHRAGKLDLAKEGFTEAQRLNPNNPEHPFSLALLAAEMNDPMGALEALKKTVEVEPNFARAWYNLGLAYAQANQLDQAIEALGKAEQVGAGPDAPYAAATILLRQGKTQEAQAILLQIMQNSPGHAPSLQLLQQISRPPAAQAPTS